MMERAWTRTTTSGSTIQFAMVGIYLSTIEVCLMRREQGQQLATYIANNNNDVVTNGWIFREFQLTNEHLIMRLNNHSTGRCFLASEADVIHIFPKEIKAWARIHDGIDTPWDEFSVGKEFVVRAWSKATDRLLTTVNTIHLSYRERSVCLDYLLRSLPFLIHITHQQWRYMGKAMRNQDCHQAMCLYSLGPHSHLG